MTLRDEIAKIVYGEHHPNDITWHNCRPKADKVLALIEAELGKAKKWDMVETIAENDCFPCPLKNSKCINCNHRIMRNMIKAIEEEINGTTK